MSGSPTRTSACSATGTSSTGSPAGIAAHHAGMLPTFREIVEELFTAGRIRAVFATETLALGINMPARTVVLEKLVKFNGEAHVDITPAEYTQLTGRAGRRGIDIEGHAVVLWNRRLDPLAVAGLASTRTYPLRSSFRPTYNMAVNLVAQVGRDRAREILETSFAQFQADRAVVGFVTDDPAQRGGPGGLRGGDALRPRRLRRVRRHPRRDRRRREGRRQASVGRRAARRRPCQPRDAARSATSSGSRRAGVRATRSWSRPARAAAARRRPRRWSPRTGSCAG